MRVECPECRVVTAVSSDLIVTRKRALELTCSKCKADILIQLSLSEENLLNNHYEVSSDDRLTRLTTPIAETEEDTEILSFKSKILRSLVELPPIRTAFYDDAAALFTENA